MADHFLICDSTGAQCTPVLASEFVADVVTTSAANADPALLGSFFAGGFGIVVTAFVIGRSVSVLLDLIRNA